MKVKIVSVMAAVVLSATLFAVASTATGAYFSDAKDGVVAGTVGTVQVETAGWNADGSDAGGMNINFKNLMPGKAQTVQVSYKNIGSDVQDIWLVFPEMHSLHALNDLGTYGSVSIKDSISGLYWHSDNLTDFYPSGTPGLSGVPTLYPVPQHVLLSSNVAPGQQGVMSFEFAYAGKLNKGFLGRIGGGVWNSYPVLPDTHGKVTYDPKGSPVGSGLPYQIVATQPGQTPGALKPLPLVGSN
jgi:hypothetical protein